MQCTRKPVNRLTQTTKISETGAYNTKAARDTPLSLYIQQLKVKILRNGTAHDCKK